MFSTKQTVNSPASHRFPLLKFSDDPNDWWTVRHALEGVAILGGIGSGKTSGSGRAIAHSFIKNGFGGLVLCAKPDEAALWKAYAEAYNRGDDLIFFQEGSKKQFNFLQYEMKRSGRGAGETINLTDLFMTTFKMGQRLSGSSSEENDKFWENALKRCLNRIIDLLKLSGEEVSVGNMVKLLSDAPTTGDTYYQVRQAGFKAIPEWGQDDYFIKCLYQAEWNPKTPAQDRQFDFVIQYFMVDFATLDPEVRGNIKESFLGYCEPFLGGLLDQHFSQGISITPEESFAGKIIILDFPVKEYLTAGIYAQCIFKQLWQQAVERRPVTTETLPVFLWVDESQYFVNEYDSIFQTTARSSKACTVFLTQNISNYYAHMGGSQVKARVDSLMANLSTKIFHANNDAVTNQWATEVIASDLVEVKSYNYSRREDSFVNTSSEGGSFQLLPQILPIEFTKLLTGGDDDYNQKQIQAIITVKGYTWSDGKNYKRLIFRQA